MEMRLMREPSHGAEASNAVRRFERDLMERLRALPGVKEASVTTSVPMRGVDFLRVVGLANGEEARAANERSVDPAYLTLMRIPLLAGRVFTDRDTDDAPPVAVVSQAFARAALGDRSPIGERLDLGDTKPQIVGVVGDVRQRAVSEAQMPTSYLPRAQDPNEVFCLVVRAQGDRAAVVAGIRKTIQSVDPYQPVERITTLEQHRGGEDVRGSVLRVDDGGLRGDGLATGVGRALRRRGPECRRTNARTGDPHGPGGRKARALVRFAVVRGLQPVLLGTGLGLAGAFWLSRLLRRFLFEVSPLDPLAYVVAAALLVAAAMAACYLPARRVTRVDPMVALRAE